MAVPPWVALRSMRVDAGVNTNPGRKRTRNEDLPVSDTTLGLFLVIDGMGHDIPPALFETLTDIIRRTADRAPHGADQHRSA